MSELAISVVAGPAHRNSGLIKDVKASIALYVGGSGAWRATNIESGLTVTVPSLGSSLGEELMAVTVLVLQLPSTEDVTRPLLAKAAETGAIDLTSQQWRELFEAARTAEEHVAVLITATEAGPQDDLAAIVQETGWSALICVPVKDLRQSQWTRARAEDRA